MTTLTNVVQPVAGNVGAGLAAAQMDLRTGEVSAMAAGLDLVAGGAGSRTHSTPADIESAVLAPLSIDIQRLMNACPISCHISADEGEQDRVAAGEIQEGGRGSGERGACVSSIGFQVTENFANGSLLVHAAALTDEGALLVRVVSTGALALVEVQGVDATRLSLPALLPVQKKKGGRLVFAGPLPAPRCPQCLIASPIDCQEQPCGWPEKKKGGAA